VLDGRFHVSHQILFFCFIGVINSAVHAVVVLTLVESSILTPVAANVCAFVVANIVSFFLNCRFTFRTLPRFFLYRRFFLVSLVSLILTVMLSGGVQLMGWDYKIGLLLVIGVAPMLTFALQKWWAFK